MNTLDQLTEQMALCTAELFLAEIRLEKAQQEVDTYKNNRQRLWQEYNEEYQRQVHERFAVGSRWVLDIRKVPFYDLTQRFEQYKITPPLLKYAWRVVELGDDWLRLARDEGEELFLLLNIADKLLEPPQLRDAQVISLTRRPNGV
jgi:hypothetical protein